MIFPFEINGKGWKPGWHDIHKIIRDGQAHFTANICINLAASVLRGCRASIYAIQNHGDQVTQGLVK